MAKCVVVYFIAQHLFVLAHSMMSTMSSGKASLNLALGKPAWQVGNYAPSNTADKAVDGEARNLLGFCAFGGGVGSSHTKMWWVVDLLETKRVSMVVIYNRGDCCGDRLVNFYIGVGQTFTRPTFNPDNFETCYKHNGQFLTGGRGTFECSRQLYGRYVSVYMINPPRLRLPLCEVEVYSFTFKNIAAGKPSFMSGIPAVISGKSKGPQYANDDRGGSISHVWPYCTVSNSHDNPWWLVDLEEKRTITRVIIMTMSGGDYTRFKDFTIAVGNSFDPLNKGSFDPSVFPTCVTVTGNLPSADNLDIICDPPLEGRYVTVHMHGVTSGILQLCEVVVYDHPAFILETTITQFPQGSVYEKHTAYLTDDNTTTCVQIQPTTSRLNLFELKLFSSDMCSDVLKVDVTFTNLSCSGNRVVVYSPTIVNGGSTSVFTEHVAQSKCNVSGFTETQCVQL